MWSSIFYYLLSIILINTVYNKGPVYNKAPKYVITCIPTRFLISRWSRNIARIISIGNVDRNVTDNLPNRWTKFFWVLARWRVRFTFVTTRSALRIVIGIFSTFILRKKKFYWSQKSFKQGHTFHFPQVDNSVTWFVNLENPIYKCLVHKITLFGKAKWDICIYSCFRVGKGLQIWL